MEMQPFNIIKGNYLFLLLLTLIYINAQEIKESLCY